MKRNLDHLPEGKRRDLAFVAAASEGLEPSLKLVWPTETKFEKRCYELLRAAYVKARYSRHYRINHGGVGVAG